MHTVPQNNSNRQHRKLPAGLEVQDAVHESLTAAIEAQAVATDSGERLLLAAECVVLHRICKGNSIAVDEWRALAAQIRGRGVSPVEIAA